MSAKRTVIEQKFKKMEAEAKRLGVTLLTKPEAFIDDDHLDCTWYGGYIGGLRYKGYEECAGSQRPVVYRHYVE